MSAVATRDSLGAAVERPQRGEGLRPFDDGGRLEDAILGLWEDVIVEGRSACPVCGGSMAAASGRAACRDCGAELS